MNVLRKIFRRAIYAREFIKAYSQHLPQAFSAIFSLPCAVVLLQGKTPVSGGGVCVLYVGRKMNYLYLVRTIFRDYDVVENIDSTILSYRKHEARLAVSADVTIVDIGWPYHGWVNRNCEFLQVPDWVGMAVEVRGSWESVVQNFRHSARNNDLRLIRRNKYRCIPTRDAADIERFYNEMYLPFVHARHNDEAVTATSRHVSRRATQGWLLQVLRDEEVVVAGVVYPENEVLYFLWIGIPEVYVESVPEAAISALYLFGIRHAFDEGLSAVDFTGTRAFLNDGAYRFKRKWGATVEDTFSPSSILVKAQKSNESAAGFFAENPMLVRQNGELDARFVVSGGPVSPDTFKQLEKQHACGGFDTVTVIEIGDFEQDSVVSNSESICRFRHVQCRLEGFSTALVR